MPSITILQITPRDGATIHSSATGRSPCSPTATSRRAGRVGPDPDIDDGV